MIESILIIASAVFVLFIIRYDRRCSKALKGGYTFHDHEWDRMIIDQRPPYGENKKDVCLKCGKHKRLSQIVCEKCSREQ